MLVNQAVRVQSRSRIWLSLDGFFAQRGLLAQRASGYCIYFARSFKISLPCATLATVHLRNFLPSFRNRLAQPLALSEPPRTLEEITEKIAPHIADEIVTSSLYFLFAVLLCFLFDGLRFASAAVTLVRQGRNI